MVHDSCPLVRTVESPFTGMVHPGGARRQAPRPSSIEPQNDGWPQDRDYLAGLHEMVGVGER